MKGLGVRIDRSNRVSLLVSFAIVAFTSLLITWRGSWRGSDFRGFSLFDDAMINMGYARTWSLTGTPTWHPDSQLIEGTTPTGYTFLMAGLHLLPLSTQSRILLVSILGALFLTLVVWLSFLVFWRGFPQLRGASWVVPLGVSLTYPLIFWSVRGFEVGLISLCLVGAVVCISRERTGRLFQTSFDRISFGSAGLLLALAVFVRQEQAVSVGAFVLGVLIYSWEKSWSSAKSLLAPVLLLITPALIVVILVTTWRWATFGQLFPNPFYAKVTSISLETRIVAGLGENWKLLPLILLALLLSWNLARSYGRKTIVVWVMLVIVAANWAYAIYTGGDAWDWYPMANRFISVVLPLLWILLVAAVAVLAIEMNALNGSSGTQRVLLAVGATSVLAGVVILLQANYPTRVASGAGLFALGILTIGLSIRRSLLQKIFKRKGQRSIGQTRLALPLVVLLLFWVVIVDNPGYLDLAVRGGLHVQDDKRAIQSGLGLREITEPEAVIAHTWAGNPQYFSERGAIDVLPRSDYVLSLTEPKCVDHSIWGGWSDWPRSCYPGHQKWDYEYSFNQLQPDVIASFWLDPPTAADLQEWGYESKCFNVTIPEIESGETVVSTWVRSESTRVRWDLEVPCAT